MNRSESAQLTRKAHLPARARLAQPFASTRVTLTWTAWNHDGAPHPALDELELSIDPGAARECGWICTRELESDWVEVLSAARCTEIVIRAKLADNLSGKHLVLELAEFLTFRFAQSKPLIRVLFLPAVSATRNAQSHA